MPFMDRASFIGLLDRLGDPDDAAALAAAREIDRRLREAGVTWDGILVPAAEEEPEVGDGSLLVADEPVPVAEGLEEDLTRIERLLTAYQLSAETRAELEDYRAEIQDGTFTDMDRRYLRDLEVRLAPRKLRA
jgi:hypothetical protein